jgi:hypothetical protein
MGPSRTFDRDALLKACLRSFGRVRLTVTGACMSPALRDGEPVDVEVTEPKLGDIVLFDSATDSAASPSLKLHRLIGVNGERLYTKPDWGPPDRPVMKSALWGVAFRLDGSRLCQDQWRVRINRVMARLEGML